MKHVISKYTSPRRRIVAGFTALACCIAQMALPPQAQAGPLGSSTASAGSVPPPSVTAVQNFQPDLFTGRATTSVPIAVPPGRKGIQPSVGLAYSSSARNSWLGVGWNLEVGSIERSTKNGAPNYSAEDFTFSFGGGASELVKRASDNTFWAKDEAAFLRFERVAGGWKVIDKAGTRYYFGSSTASQLLSGSNVFRWYLDKVVDMNGNAMTVTYEKSLDSDCYLKQIDYTSHLAANDTTQLLAPSNKVVFTLETTARADQEVSFRPGFAVQTTRRLQKIETFAKQTQAGAYQLARRYDFTYTLSARSGRSLLSSVTEYGTDGTTHLRPITFTYQGASGAPTYQMASPSQYLKPPLAGDFNGDGLTDTLRFDTSSSPSKWRVALSTPTGSGTEQEWLSGFGSSASTPVVGDWNADGRTDVGTYASGTWQFALSYSSPNRFDPGPWNSVVGPSGAPLAGDFNGDRIMDLGVFDKPSGTWSTAKGTGSGFNSFTSITWGANNDALTGDFNGDGYTDIAVYTGGTVKVRLSNGSSFEPEQTWLGGTIKNITTADINGDGLTDIVSYDNSYAAGTGRVWFCASKGSAASGMGFEDLTLLPPVFVGHADGSGYFLQMGDFNGDSLTDLAVLHPNNSDNELALSGGGFTDLLGTIANGLSGTTTLTYQPSTMTVSSNPVLPFVLPLVQKVDLLDGLGHTYSTTYSYSESLYDSASREFRGFGKVTAQNALGTTTTTEFYQYDSRRGRPFRIEVRNNLNQLFSRQEQEWDFVEPQTAGSYFVRLVQADSYIYDGDASFKQTRSRLTYDTDGNVLQQHEDGDPAVADGERCSKTTYVKNTTARILSTPQLVEQFAGATCTGTVLAQRRFAYDTLAVGAAPTKGLLTKEEEWLNPGNTWLTTTLAYDGTYGNVTTVTDAEGRSTSNTYDTEFFTYLKQISNALTPTPHTRSFNYDARTGQVTSTTDPNGQTTSTDYDSLGRVTQVYGPVTTQALPSVQYTYDACLVAANMTPCAAPVRTTAKTRVTAGASTTLDVHAFADGMGRTIQTRSPAEDPAKQVVTGTAAFNNLGQVVSQYSSYLSNLSTGNGTAYVALESEPNYTTFPKATYIYDAVGRLLTTTAPGGFVSSTSYSDWLITATDANGNVVKRTQDAFGRLTKVEEINGSSTYTTDYQYDVVGNLTKVTDAGVNGARNETTLVYDSLGRKTSMDDPDMGVWSYTYDKIDNLKTQTDARGAIITFTYDPINRLTLKAYTTVPSGVTNPGNVTYTYDVATTNTTANFAKGRLKKVDDGNGTGSAEFEYDAFGRLIKEVKTITGSGAGTHTVQRAYDLLGRLTLLTYPGGDTAAYAYTGQGGIATLTYQPVGGSAKTIVTNMDYDASGRITAMAYGNNTTTTYSYNATTQRLAELTTFPTASPQSPIQKFTYMFDDVGNVESITDLVGSNDQSFTYDPLNRLTQAIGPYGTSSYQYNAIGNMTSKENVTLTYPASGATSIRPHAVISTLDGWTFNYDANGNLIDKRQTSGGGTCAAYPSTCTDAQTLKYDADNRMIESTNVGRTVSITLAAGWNSFSLPVQPDDATVAAVFPTFAQDVEQISRLNPQTATPNSWQHYVGDAAFNQFNTLEVGKAYQVYVKNAAGLTVTVSGKQVTPAAQSLTVGWNYLPAKIDGASVTTTAWLSGVAASEVRKVDPASGGTVVVTQVSAGQAYWVNVSTGGNWTAPTPNRITQFVYDGDGGRVKQTDASGTTVFLGDVVEIDPAGAHTRYIFAGNQRIAARVGSTYRYYHSDHLGSTSIVTDDAGAIIERAEYAPYGKLTNHSGSANVAHKFTGQRSDSNTGLYFYHARYYDPQIGRFIQPDSIVQDPSDPQTLNRYSYVRNNPINLVDPSGYGFLAFIQAIAAAVFAVAVTVAITASTVSYIAAETGHERTAQRAAQVARTASNVAWTSSIIVGAGTESVMPSFVAAGTMALAKAATQHANHAADRKRQQEKWGLPETNAEQATLQDSWSPTDFMPGPGGAARASSGLLSNLLRLGEGGFVRISKGGLRLAAKEIADVTAIGAKDVAVIGTREATLALKGQPGLHVLDVPEGLWSMAVNKSWGRWVIKNQFPVRLASPLNYGTLWNMERNTLSVFAREIRQFLNAGYRKVGQYLLPPE